MEELTGGRKGAIYSDGDSVYRPLQPWSRSVHLLLNHLSSSNMAGCPRLLAIVGEQEVLSYVAGDTYNYPLSGSIATLEALKSAARLLREIHDSTVLFMNQREVAELPWMLAPREPFEVICHGDFTPYNVALTNNAVTGVFDFDTAHPGPRVWDLAYSVYCWAPFKTDSIDRLGSLEDQLLRAKVFCDTYGVKNTDRQHLAEVMVIRLEALVSFIREQAVKGHQQFANDIEQGHLNAYLNDIEYIKENKFKIKDALCS